MKEKYETVTLALLFVLFLKSEAAGYQFSFEPRLNVSEQYTDNLYLSEENAIEEFITTFSLGFSLALTDRARGLSIAYDPAYTVYKEYDEYNTWRHDASISGWADLAKHTRVNISDNFVHSEDPLSEADLAVIRTTETNFPLDTTERRGRNTYSRNVARVSLIHRFGALDSLRLGYRDILLVNDDSTVQDNSVHEPWAGITWHFLPHWALDLDGRYTKGDYEFSEDRDRIFGSLRFIHQFNRQLDGYIRYAHTEVSYDGVSGDDRTYNPSLGIDYEIEEDIALHLEIGYFINDFELREDQDGMTGEALLIKRFQRGSINFSTLGGYNYADFGSTETNGFERFVESAVSGTYIFARRFSGNIAGSYRYSDYVDFGREEDSMWASAGLAVRPLEWMIVDLRYSYSLLDSTEDADDYQENRAMLTIRLAPATPYRTSNY